MPDFEMPRRMCATCNVVPEARLNARQCLRCLEQAEATLRQLRAEGPARVPPHVTATWLRHWAVGAVADVKHLSPMAHILRGVIQGVVIAGDAIRDEPGGHNVAGLVVAVELVAMQALAEVRT